jgi:putative zinc finger/helix-turn-helix YgiT family protein
MTRETSETSKTTETPDVQGKPFPWPCPECGKKAVQPAIIQHASQIKHDGRLYTVAVPTLRVPRCSACGELVFDSDADEQIARAFRAKLGLLSGDQIRKNREDLGLSQRILAEHLGVAMETISRWENGALTQTRAMDRYLRVYFGVPAARAALLGQSGSLDLGVQLQT